MQKINRYALRYALLWLPFGLPLVQAQVITPAEPAEAPDAQRRYTVEMIVFEYAESAYTGNEMFLPDVIEPDPTEPVESELIFSDVPLAGQAMPDGKPSIEEIPLTRPRDMFVVDPGNYSMKDIYRKLQLLDAYKPIMHTAWTQTTVDKDLALPIRLRRLGNAPLRLDGNLTLYLSRYLHLVIDLTLDADDRAQRFSANPESPSEVLSSGRPVYADKPEWRPAPVRYRIYEDRIFKIGDLRYFDHPRFGALVKVTRYEPGKDESMPAGSMLSDASAW